MFTDENTVTANKRYRSLFEQYAVQQPGRE